jgi:hypothetical protein
MPCPPAQDKEVLCHIITKAQGRCWSAGYSGTRVIAATMERETEWVAETGRGKGKFRCRALGIRCGQREEYREHSRADGL